MVAVPFYLDVSLHWFKNNTDTQIYLLSSILKIYEYICLTEHENNKKLKQK